MSDETREKPTLTHLIGNVGKGGPKEVTVNAGKANEGVVVKFSHATPITNGNKENPGDTFWVDLSIFDEKQKAQAMSELKQGDTIAVTGVLKTREWEDNDGNKRIGYQMIPQRISHIDWWEREPYVPKEVQESGEWKPPF